MFVKMLRFRSWIQQNRLYKYDLCKNPNYVQFMERDYELIDWEYLSINTLAIDLLIQKSKKNLLAIFFGQSCSNTIY